MLKFEVNEGVADRIIRAIISVGLIIGGVISSGILQIVLIASGVVLGITAITGFCGVYALLGINTCGTKK
ncbi:MAG: DUF2892 domain-containing protein [Spirochaetia bacterium]|nr:DUF2892 domain-containing protein [Spirochaetota bacterium]MCX8096320.1 DUF2892 domain-containing protein [Spirochaetota bacterium]MDW8112319.1 DUF2892 domain-containing protein [Spirochaetia bacterium]